MNPRRRRIARARRRKRDEASALLRAWKATLRNKLDAVIMVGGRQVYP